MRFFPWRRVPLATALGRQCDRRLRIEPETTWITTKPAATWTAGCHAHGSAWHVLSHEVSEAGTGPVDRFHEPHSAAIFGQKRPPGKARERQRMGISRFVRIVDTLSGVGSCRGRVVIVAERFAVTTFCRSFADMPTQSRGHGTRRSAYFVSLSEYGFSAL